MNELDTRTLFEVGVDRELPALLDPPDSYLRLNLGAGKKSIPGTVPMDRESGWQAPYLRDIGDDTVAAIYAFHFMEHLSGDDAVKMLSEIERVLVPGGVFYYCIPHASAESSQQDLDHKSQWTESTMKNLFNNPYYDKPHDLESQRPWRLVVHSQWIQAVVARNLCIFGQLVKV